MIGSLHFENVHAGYGKKDVLRDLTLIVSPSEVVALIGPNGAGKSTALRVAAGFLAPAQGRVWLGGQDVTQAPAHARVTLGLAYSMQGGRVFQSLTVQEHFAMGASVANGVRHINQKAVLDLFPNLYPLLDRRAGLLSGGERQALALAIALYRRPHVLLLDEPSAGLAPGLTRDLLEQVLQLSRTQGIGVLLVEQDVDTALMIADRAVALVAGKVALETDKPKTWLASSELESLFFGRTESESQPLRDRIPIQTHHKPATTTEP
ncbi:MAG: ABC transporter ATP-binding protein [Bacteroidota bacterium]